MNADRLLNLYDRIADAPDAIARLRRFVLDLAIRGKLVEQDPADEPASELLKRISIERAGQSTKEKDRSAGPVAEECPKIELPTSWALTSLGEISLRLHYGYTASASKTDKEIRLLRITDIQDDHVEWANVPGCAIDAKTITKYALEPGDLLIARTGGTIGKTFLVSDVPVKSVFASYLIRVQPARSLHAPYVKLFCGSDFYWDQLREGSRGAGQPNVNGKTLGRMRVSLPPLAEQHRIVAKVDALMALCDRLEAALTTWEATRNRLTTASLARLTAPDTDAEAFPAHARFALDALPALTARSDQIKQLRQTILDLAVRGKLVEQDPADEPASELLKRISIERAGQSTKEKDRSAGPVAEECPKIELPTSWALTSLGEISLRLHYGYTASASKTDKEIRLLRITDIQDDHVEWANVPGCAIDAKTITKYALEPGDLLIARTGGTIGKTFLVSDVPVKSVFASYLIRVQPARSLHAPYVKLFCGSDFYWDQLREGSRGAGQPNVNGKTLGRMRVSLPPLAEQHRIVAKVDALMALCDRLEAALTTADTTRQRLLEALLHEALTPGEDQEEAA